MFLVKIFNMPTQIVLQSAFFFNCSSQFSVPKWKTMGSQSEILFHEILDVQKILVGWTTFFRTVKKDHPVWLRDNMKISFYLAWIGQTSLPHK